MDNELVTAELLQAAPDLAILDCLDTIIALLRDIRDRLAHKTEEPPKVGPFMRVNPRGDSV